MWGTVRWVGGGEGEEREVSWLLLQKLHKGERGSWKEEKGHMLHRQGSHVLSLMRHVGHVW